MRIPVHILKPLTSGFIIICLLAGMLLWPSMTQAAAPGGFDWSANATSFRGQNGVQFTYVCSAGGIPGNLWGTDTYTDDSSVCTAALHTGLLNTTTGGIVTIEIRPGLDDYVGSTRNGVTSDSYGSWDGSYVVIGVVEGAGGVKIGGGGWSANATDFAKDIGGRYQYICPPGGAGSSVWGTYTYTVDSSVCTAAVQVGLVTFAQGGNVTIQISLGLTSYEGSTRNGVTTNSYGSWGGSYTFPDATAPLATAVSSTATSAPTQSATPVAAIAVTETSQIGPSTAGDISLDTTLGARSADGQSLPSTVQQFHLLIPTSAVQQQTAFSVGIVAPAAVPQSIVQPGIANNVGVGAAYNLRAGGVVTLTTVTTFTKPLVLQLSYDPGELTGAGLDPRNLTIAYFAPPTSPTGVGKWIGIPTTVLPGTTLLTAPLTHFTLYQVRATARTQAQVANARIHLAELAAAGPPQATALPAAPILAGMPVVVTLPEGQLAQHALVTVLAAPGSTIRATYKWGKTSLIQNGTSNSHGLAALVFQPPTSFPKTSTRVFVSVQVRNGTQTRLFSGAFVLVDSLTAPVVQATLSVSHVHSGQEFVVTVNTTPGLLVAVDVIGSAHRVLATQHGTATSSRYQSTFRLSVGPHDPTSQVLQVVVTIQSGTRVGHQTLTLTLLR